MLSKLYSLARKPALRQGSVVVVDQGILSLATFLTGVLVARSATTHEYGLYVLGWSIFLVAQGVYRNLIVVPLLVYAPRMDAPRLYSYQGSSLAHTILYACIASGICLGIGAFHSVSQDIETRSLYELLPLISLMIPALLWREFIRQTLLGQLKIWASVGVNILATLLITTIVCLLFLENHLTPDYAYLCFAAISFVTAAAMQARHRHEFRLQPGDIWKDFRKSWKIGKWASLNVIGFLGMSQIYPWLLLYMIDHKAVAIFGACMAVASFINPIMRGANAYILPRIAHGFSTGNRERLLSLMWKSIVALLIPYSAWLLTAFIFQDSLVPLFYSETYQGYGILFLLLVLKTVIDSVTSPLNSVLQTAELARKTTTSLLAGSIVTIALGPLLIMSMGITGAGIASVAASVASAAWKFSAVRKINSSAA